MSQQKDIFLKHEGDQWFARNSAAIDVRENERNDPLNLILTESGILPARVLEVGCSNGWRLGKLRKVWTGACFSGVDPSLKAIEEGRARYPEFDLRQATADNLPFESQSIDLLVFGFCLYLTAVQSLKNIQSIST